MPWLTPNEDTEGGFDSRTLSIPRPFTPIVTGLLYKLVDFWNWEDFGDITKTEAIAAMQAMIDTYLEGNPMIGAVIPYATTNLPSNCLACDGSSYARTSYPLLYAVLDSSFIDDADTFHTPDMDAAFPMGAESDIGGSGVKLHIHSLLMSYHLTRMKYLIKAASRSAIRRKSV